MTIYKLLEKASEAGVLLWQRDGKLHFKLTGNIFPDALKNEIRANKEALIDFLKQKQLDDKSTLSTQSIIPKIHRDKNVTTSFTQQGLWLIDQVFGGSQQYNLPFALLMQGHINEVVIQDTFTRIIERHEPLRTTFLQGTDLPLQHIHQTFEFQLGNINLCELPADQQQQLVFKVAEADEQKPFDLKSDLMLRATFIRLSGEEGVLLFNMHHIASDDWSLRILVSEFKQLYEAFSEGKPDPLPPLKVEYADYAIWQRNRLQGEVFERQLKYWEKHLNELPLLHSLPLDKPRPAVQSINGAVYRLEIEPDVIDGLKRVAINNQTTVFMVIHAIFGLLLWRYSGSEDIVIGTPVANRMLKEVEKIIGLFSNVLVLRTKCRERKTSKQYLKHVMEVNLDAQDNQEIPFEFLVERLNPKQSTSYGPLFQIMLSMNTIEENQEGLKAIKITPLNRDREAIICELILNILLDGKDLRLNLAYNKDLFDQSTIERMAAHFKKLMIGVINNVDEAIDNLPLLYEAERQQLLMEWNNTSIKYPPDKCVHQLFEEQVERSPDRVALVFEDEQLSYRELNARANQLAHYLLSLGVGPEQRIAICLERSLEMIVSLLAVLKAGGAYVPLDPSYPSERKAWMLENSGAEVVITQEKYWPQSSQRSQRVFVFLSEDSVLSVAKKVKKGVIPTLNADNLAYIIYTSGTTGIPKGVAISHKSLCNQLLWAKSAFNIKETDRFLHKASFSFDASVEEIFVPLITGSQLVSASSGVERDVDYLVQLISEKLITCIDLSPSLLQILLSNLQIDRLSSVRLVISGGEELKRGLVEAFEKKFSQAHLWNTYGPTETTIQCLYASDLSTSQIVPIGKPVANTQAYVIDSSMKLQPYGIGGELYVGGTGVARGYWAQAELTAERFVPDPLDSQGGGRLYRTGDLVRQINDGNIQYLGRIDTQVKIRGFRIEPGEIESRLLKYEGVESAVVLVKDEGGGGKKLVAYYTGYSGAEIEAEQLRMHLASTLPDYMLPAAYVYLETMPLTPNGKLDRRALPEPEDESYARRGYEEPQGEIEISLAGIWSELLRVERVGRWDDFFMLGGHSLLAISLIEQMRRKGFHTDVRMLFTYPTLQALAESVEADHSVVDVPPNLIPSVCNRVTPSMLPLVELTQKEIDLIVSGVDGGAGNVQDIYPLAPLQEGMLFHHLISEHGDTYLTYNLLSFDTEERLNEVIDAMIKVIASHDILRTAVVWEGVSEPVQVVWREVKMPVEYIELDVTEGDACEQLLKQYDPRRIRLDLNRAPLMKFIVAQDVANDRWLGLWLSHHMTTDHTTLEKMIYESQQHILGVKDELLEPLPFRNHVAQARQGLSREEHERFFRKMLGDMEEPTAPFGIVEAQGDELEVEKWNLEMDEDQSKKLRERARRLGVSVASICHVGWGRVLSAISGTEDVVFGTVLFGRMQSGEGSDRAFGLFINTLPIRLRVGGESVESSVRATQGVLRELMKHEHASLALVQRCSGVPAPTPLFSTLLNYRHSPRQIEESGEAAEVWRGIRLLRSWDRTNYPVLLSIDDYGDGFGLSAQTVSGIEGGRICQYMVKVLDELVEALERNPQKQMRSIEVLPETEHRQLLERWNDIARKYPQDKCVHELFEEQAEKNPDGVALVFEDQQLSYRELNARANQLAHNLRRLGVGPEVRVAICHERSFEMVVSMLAVLKAGGVYVPLDSSYPSERIAWMLEDSAATILLTNNAMSEMFFRMRLRILIVNMESEERQWAYQDLSKQLIAGIKQS